MAEKYNDSPAGRVMDEAIEAAIAEKPICPEASAFINADTPFTEREIVDALDQGYAAVVASEDGSVRIFHPEPTAG